MFDLQPSESVVPIVTLDVCIEKHRLWRRLRIDGSNMRRMLEWWQMIDQWAGEARNLIKPRGAFRLCEVDEVTEDEVRLAGGVRLERLREARLFRRAEKIAMCALTLGNALEERCNALAVTGDHPESSLLSMIGDSALAEGQAKLISLAQGCLAGTELRSGVVLQPGAQYWALQGNTIFPSLLPLESLGIQILESFALQPSKSKTFACAFTMPKSAVPVTSS